MPVDVDFTLKYLKKRFTVWRVSREHIFVKPQNKMTKISVPTDDSL